jgi:hypothetical protein
MLAANQTGYSQGSAPTAAPAADDVTPAYLSHGMLKKQFLSYLGTKSDEISEQKDARRFYHGSQFTEKQQKTSRQRNQPLIPVNEIEPIINSIIGTLEQQKQDPRAYPRTPKQDEGAELATSVLRYVCDTQDWGAISSESGMNGAIDGIGGVEITIIEGDHQDPDVGLTKVDPSSFFYDPRSLKMDFSDARFMGIAKWADIEEAVEMFPDKEAELRASLETGSELTSNPDSDAKWFSDGETSSRIRIVDHWYLKGGHWYYCIYTGSTVLAEGKSFLTDERGKGLCKYIMYSSSIDQDGDRYGFIRNIKPLQQGFNNAQSKTQHTINSRRVIIPAGTGADINAIRMEASRPDGVITYPTGTEPPQFDDNAKGQEITALSSMLEWFDKKLSAKRISLTGSGDNVDNLSGVALRRLQNARVTELGPFLLHNRNWKIRVYRAIWNAIEQYWQSERWIRVTDDQKISQFFAVNQMGIDPNTGLPALINALGSLDVDIIIDEGPDTINMQQDAYDTLSILAQKGVQVPPELLIELSSLDFDVKKRSLEILEKAKAQASQPDPVAQAGQQAEIAELNASARLKEAQAIKAIADARAAGQPQGAPQQDAGPTDIDVAKALAEIRNKDAGTQKTAAETDKIRLETTLMPVEAAHQISEASASRDERMFVHQDQMKQASQDRSRHP